MSGCSTMKTVALLWITFAWLQLAHAEIVGRYKVLVPEPKTESLKGMTKFGRGDYRVCSARKDYGSGNWIFHNCDKLSVVWIRGTPAPSVYFAIDPNKISTHIILLPASSEKKGAPEDITAGPDLAKIPLMFPKDDTIHFLRFTSGSRFEISLNCVKDFFGPRCSVFCDSSVLESRYSCHPQTGEIVCSFGWTGRSCSENVFIDRKVASQFLKSRPRRSEDGGDCSTRRCSKEELRDEFLLRGSDFTDRDWIDYRGGENLHACDERYCHVNGTDLCLRMAEGYHLCRCKPGYTGTRCSEADLCYSEPCFNGAACENTVEGAVCECRSGFTGKLCEIQIDHCLDDPCGYHGECESDATGFRCVCDAGFTDEKCETNIEDCREESCSGNGLCQDGINTYDCLCDEGYIGRNCEIASNGCLSDPCKNGGTCKNFVGGYFECDCPENFEGWTCTEERKNPCDGDPCNGNGKCHVVFEEEEGPDYSYEQAAFCVCDFGFTGQYCEGRATSCDGAELPCPPNSTCVNLENEYVCVCPNGYEGENCEVRCDPCEIRNELRCESNPCKNNARCVVSGGNTTCLCRAGFTGDRCQIAIDFCDGIYCGHGECLTAGDGYICSCEHGYAGSNCEREIDECKEENGLCKNGGQCQNTYGAYRCLCLKGYEGEHCDYKVDACHSQPCKNGGACREAEGDSFQCDCKTGFVGRTCDEMVNLCGDDPPHCQNGAECEVVSLERQEVSCSCTERFYGNRCEREIPACMVKRETADGGHELTERTDCGSYGKCIPNGKGSFRCECRDGYQGKFCEQRVKVTACKEPRCVCEVALHNFKALHNKGHRASECHHPTYGKGKCSSDICLGRNCTEDDSKLICKYNQQCLENSEYSRGSEADTTNNSCSVFQLRFNRMKLPEKATLSRLCDEVRKLDPIRESENVILQCKLRKKTLIYVHITAEITSRTSELDDQRLARQLFQYLDEYYDQFNGSTHLAALKNASFDGTFVHARRKQADVTTSSGTTGPPVNKQPTSKRTKEIIIIAVAAICAVLFLVLVIGFIVWVKKRKPAQRTVSTTITTLENNNMPVGSVKWFKNGKSSEVKLASFENPLIFGADNSAFSSGENSSSQNPRIQERIEEESRSPEVSSSRNGVSTFFPMNGEMCLASSDGAVKR